MSESFGKLIKSTAVLSAANAVQAAAGFLLLPVYTRYLTPADYGLAELLTTSVMLSTLLVGQGMPSAVLRRYNFVHQDDAGAQRISGSTALAYMLACGFLFCCVLAACRAWLSEVIFDDGQYERLVLVGLTVTLLHGAAGVCESVLRAQFRAGALGAVRLVNFLARAGIVLYLLIPLGWGFESLIYGLAGAEVISTALALFLVRGHIVARFSGSELREMLRYGLPLVGSAASFFVLSLSDRYFLRFLAEPADIGLYSIADRLAGALNLLVFLPLLGMLPSAYFEIARREPEDAPSQFARFGTQFVAGGLLLVAGMVLLAELPVRVLFPENFHPATGAVGILAFAYFLFALSDLLKLGLNITGNTLLLPVRVLVAAVANLGLNWLLIPPFGFHGAAAATALSYGILCIAGWVLSHRYYPIPYETRRLAVISLAALVVLAGHLATADLEDLPRMGLRAGIFVAFGLFLLATRLLEPMVLLRVIRKDPA